jgi:primosomal protein N'
LAEQLNSIKFVRVVVDRAIRRELDYSVPETLAERVVVGSRVRVPFRDKSLLATVIATLAESPAPGIKPLEALVGEKPVLS